MLGLYDQGEIELFRQFPPQKTEAGIQPLSPHTSLRVCSRVTFLQDFLILLAISLLGLLLPSFAQPGFLLLELRHMRSS